MVNVTLQDKVSAVVVDYDQALTGFAGIQPMTSIRRKEVKLTETDVLNIHTLMCKNFGGETGVRDNGLLSCICEQTFQDVFGIE